MRLREHSQCFFAICVCTVRTMHHKQVQKHYQQQLAAKYGQRGTIKHGTHASSGTKARQGRHPRRSPHVLQHPSSPPVVNHSDKQCTESTTPRSKQLARKTPRALARISRCSANAKISATDSRARHPSQPTTNVYPPHCALRCSLLLILYARAQLPVS